MSRLPQPRVPTAGPRTCVGAQVPLECGVAGEGAVALAADVAAHPGVHLHVLLQGALRLEPLAAQQAENGHVCTCGRGRDPAQALPGTPGPCPITPLHGGPHAQMAAGMLGQQKGPQELQGFGRHWESQEQDPGHPDPADTGLLRGAAEEEKLLLLHQRQLGALVMPRDAQTQGSC